jgi:hypothetical protein
MANSWVRHWPSLVFFLIPFLPSPLFLVKNRGLRHLYSTLCRVEGRRRESIIRSLANLDAREHGEVLAGTEAQGGAQGLAPPPPNAMTTPHESLNILLILVLKLTLSKFQT